MQLKYKKKHHFKLCGRKRNLWSKQWHPSGHGQVFPLREKKNHNFLLALNKQTGNWLSVNCFNSIFKPSYQSWEIGPGKQLLNLKWSDSVSWGYFTCTFTHMSVPRRHARRLICNFAWWWIVVIVAEHLPKNESVKLTMEQAYNWGRGSKCGCSVFLQTSPS